MDDALGDRMKEYEGQESDRMFLPMLPVVARLDGKNFSSFTRGLARPYDERLSNLMVAVTTHLVKETSACVGYTQSDEISLAWYSAEWKSQIYFDGRIQKMTSVLAATCSVAFVHLLAQFLPERDQYGDGDEVAPTPLHKLPVFDCRVWQSPTLDEAANTFLWREKDATKNSVSMAAQEYYSHRELMGKSGREKVEMLFQKGVSWNDYPAFFKRGTFVQKKTVKSKLTVEEVDLLPEKHHARQNPDAEFDRSIFRTLDVPPFSQVTNRVGVLFRGEDPITNRPPG